MLAVSRWRGRSGGGVYANELPVDWTIDFGGGHAEASYGNLLTPNAGNEWT